MQNGVNGNTRRQGKSVDKRMVENKNRKKLKKKRFRIFLCCFLWVVILSFCGGFLAGRHITHVTADTIPTVVRVNDEIGTDGHDMLEDAKQDVRQLIKETVPVGPPRILSSWEIQEIFAQRAKENEVYFSIMEQMESYPSELLEQLANNPEMVDFVVNYPQQINCNQQKATLTPAEREADCPLFLQWDERWGYANYGDSSCIALCGCGPTALSMVVVALTDQEQNTPDEVAKFSLENGYYLSGTGTKWSLMTDGARQLGLLASDIETKEASIQTVLDNGGLVICSMSKGDFTARGHFIVIYDYDETGYYVNDPFCIYRSKQVWKYEALQQQMKAAWSFYKNGYRIWE